MKVLIAVDQSAASDRALNEALDRPWPEGSHFQLLNVLQPRLPPPIADVVDRRAGQALEERAAQLRSRGLHAEWRVRHGDPRTIVLDTAASWNAELILMGAHSGGMLERFLLGSVSRAVLNHATCPVEIVRGPVFTDGAYKVLLAVNESDHAMRAARWVASLPWPKGTEARVLSAIEFKLSFLRSSFEIPVLDEPYLKHQEEVAMQSAQSAIYHAREAVEPTGLSVSEHISVLLDPPKKVILDEAASWGANLIVVGASGRRGTERFLLGSTSEAVAQHAQCSVAVVR